jgi:hypothetical protein
VTWTVAKDTIGVKKLILDECFSGGPLTAAGSWSFSHCLRRGAHNVACI